MHIEPGFVSSTKIALANTAALGLLASQTLSFGRHAAWRQWPQMLLRTGLAGLFFTLAMQSFSAPVGPSELHFVAALPIYLSLGFLPTLFGFAIGLLLQGLLFNPGDLVHLGVNFLSLAVPLLLLHRTRATLPRLDLPALLRLDALYYSGVTLMVGFWLALAEVATPLAAWGSFALSYLAVMAVEPLLTLAVLALLRRNAKQPLLAYCFAPAGR